MNDNAPSVAQMLDLKGRVALVTGAAIGIGREIACGLLEMGAKVACTSRNWDRAVTASEELRDLTDGHTLALALDVRDEQSVSAAFDQVVSTWERLDILVNNAGGAPDARHYHVWDRELDDWKYVIDTNLTGSFLCTRAAARIMMPAGRGSIINIASIAGLVGRDRRMYQGQAMRPNLVDYAASKAGIIGFTRDAAAELAPHGIRVNAISPGGIQRNQPPEFIERYADATALRRMGREGFDMKGAVVFLASDAAAYITGENLVIDGGFAMYK